jgi:predicted TIM-barrel fold metal-dependent hydrolase
MVGERPFTFMDSLFFDTAVRPGSLVEMLRSMRSGDMTDSAVEGPVEAAFVERSARLARLDEQGVEACFMFPTLAVCLEHFMSDDPDIRYATLRAFNRWVVDEWGFGDDGRIYAAAYLSLYEPSRAATELRRVVDAGARIVNLRAGPAFGRSFADPSLDAFWGLAAEAGVVVAYHIGEAGYNERCAPAFGESANPTSHEQSALQWTCLYGDRPIMETVAALVFHNVFGRFPGLRVLSVENGSLWVGYLLKAMDKMVGMGRNGPWPGGRLDAKPSEIVRRHVSVSPYHEEPIGELVDLIGADRVVFGSDYPHPEGLRAPADFLDVVADLDDRSRRAVMHDNAATLVRR